MATLSAMQMERLAWLRNRSTTYEIEIVRAGQPSLLLFYVGRRSGVGLRRAIRARGEMLMRVLTGGKLANMNFHMEKGAAVLDDGTIIRFSGRTERDAIMQGELTSVAAVS